MSNLNKKKHTHTFTRWTKTRYFIFNFVWYSNLANFFISYRLRAEYQKLIYRNFQKNYFIFTLLSCTLMVALMKTKKNLKYL